MMSAFMFPIYLATNKIQKHRREETPQIQQKAQLEIETREAHGRPRQTRERQKLKHGNLQISKGLCIIIRYC